MITKSKNAFIASASRFSALPKRKNYTISMKILNINTKEPTI